MESDRFALAALDAVEAERAESARRYVVPAGYDVALGAAVALLVGGIALTVGTGHATPWSTLLLAAAMALLGWQVRRFVAANGTWVSGLRAGPTRWVAASGLAVEVAAVAVACLAAAAGQWLLVAVVSATAGAVLAWSSRQWSLVHRRSLAG